MQPIKHHVCIVDDDPAVSRSLALLLETNGCKVTHYPSGVDFLNSDIRNFRGCVLLDVRMPGKDGITVLKEALQINPNLQVVMISGHGDIPMAIKAIELGAVNFIEKPFRSSSIMQALEKACSQLDKFDAKNKFYETAKLRLSRLTPRELEISEKLIEGKSNKIVAFELGISIRTVETHRGHILSKMQVRSLAELVKLHLAAEAKI